MKQNQAMDFLELKHQKPEYANWVSMWIPLSGSLVTLLFAGAAALCAKSSALAAGLLTVAAIVAFAFTFYMLRARTALSYAGGGVQGKVLEDVLKTLDQAGFNGHGKLLDIGCGSGAMSIKAAKKYPRALITAMDYWGAGWDYSQRLCEHNAQVEKVASRITFRKGDAAKLDFMADTFDAAVSNFVFHEVRSQKDKHALVLEALRVLKPGGCFAFQDIFFAKSHYGDINAFVEALRPYVSEIHFVDTRHPSYAPKFLSSPIILGQMGMIYGRK